MTDTDLRVLLSSVAALRDGTRADAVREAQRELKSRGFLTGLVDGIIGPQTRAAIEAWRAAIARGPVCFIATPVVAPVANTDAMRTALAIMRSWARRRIRERTTNRGREVDAIIGFGGGTPEPPSSWCARGVCAALVLAGDAHNADLETPLTGAVRKLWQQATVRYTAAEVRANPALVRAGMIMIRARDEADVPDFEAGSPLGHTGLADVIGADRWVPTAECNTSSGVDADGDGVYDKPRGIHLDDPKLVGFVVPQFRSRVA